MNGRIGRLDEVGLPLVTEVLPVSCVAATFAAEGGLGGGGVGDRSGLGLDFRAEQSQRVIPMGAFARVDAVVAIYRPTLEGVVAYLAD